MKGWVERGVMGWSEVRWLEEHWWSFEVNRERISFSMFLAYRRHIGGSQLTEQRPVVMRHAHHLTQESGQMGSDGETRSSNRGNARPILPS